MVGHSPLSQANLPWLQDWSAAQLRSSLPSLQSECRSHTCSALLQLQADMSNCCGSEWKPSRSQTIKANTFVQYPGPGDAVARLGPAAELGGAAGPLAALRPGLVRPVRAVLRTTLQYCSPQSKFSTSSPSQAQRRGRQRPLPTQRNSSGSHAGAGPGI